MKSEFAQEKEKKRKQYGGYKRDVIKNKIKNYSFSPRKVEPSLSMQSAGFLTEPPPKPPDRTPVADGEEAPVAKKGRHGEESEQRAYRDCLMSDTAVEATMVDVVGAMKISVSKEDVQVSMTGNDIHVTTSVGLRDRLAKSFKYAVVVNLLGRSIGYKSLCTKLGALWNMNAAKVLDMGYNYFLVQFDNELAYLGALLEGPWMVLGSYLQVQPWSMSFRVHHQAPRTANVWCRLPELPLHFYPPEVIRAIGSAIGHVIRIDDNTSELQRGRFARLAVSVDLDEPLVSKFYLDGQVQKVEYENMDDVCFYCCRFGHREAFCQWKPKEGDVNKEGSMSGEGNAQGSDGYSPWIVVEKRKRQPRRSTENKENANPNTGSRFDPLSRNIQNENEGRTENGRQSGGGASEMTLNFQTRPALASHPANDNRGKQVRHRDVTSHQTRGESSVRRHAPKATLGDYFDFQLKRGMEETVVVKDTSLDPKHHSVVSCLQQNAGSSDVLAVSQAPSVEFVPQSDMSGQQQLGRPPDRNARLNMDEEMGEDEDEDEIENASDSRSVDGDMGGDDLDFGVIETRS